MNVPVPRVETAQLSLAAIMAKFPEELRKLVLKMPSPDAMVVMPLPTIQKLLPTGSVKMSLASVVRQAPPGTFSTINPQDKRMVDVPLAEIFKRIPPALLKKRTDQKYSDLAADGFDIFGDEENPHALAPRVEGSIETAPAPKPPALGGAPKVLKMPPGMVAAPPPSVPAPFAQRPAATAQPAASLPHAPAPAPRVAAAPPPNIPPLFSRQSAPVQAAPVAHAQPPAPKATPPAAKPAEPAADAPPLVIAIKDLATHWPEPIKSEAVALNGATVALPAAEVSAGLARGKVAFAWGQLRSWMNPPPGGDSNGSDAVELQLPLRVIAPAFLKHTKAGATARKAAEVGDIPELFAGGNAAPPSRVAPLRAAPAPTPTPEPEPEREPEPEAVAPEPEPAAEVEQAPVEAEAPSMEAEPVSMVSEAAPLEMEPAAEEAPAEVAAEAAPAFEAPAPVEEIPSEPAAAAEVDMAPAEVAAEAPLEVAPTAEVSAPAPAAPEPSPIVAEKPATAAGLPQTLGEVFGKPDKTSWLPTEVVKHLSEIPGVAGALVALQEGLVIAHRLPEPFKGEVFAAFLPQIFARLNQYSGEMKLGGVSEILIQANGGPCHLFRRGQVYFAALGQPESTLPIHVLRLCADAVAS